VICTPGRCCHDLQIAPVGRPASACGLRTCTGAVPSEVPAAEVIVWIKQWVGQAALAVAVKGCCCCGLGGRAGSVALDPWLGVGHQGGVHTAPLYDALNGSICIVVIAALGGVVLVWAGKLLCVLLGTLSLQQGAASCHGSTSSPFPL
jgi:hypothetical protein